jgi:hypothetical protein
MEGGKGPVTRYYILSLLSSLAKNRSPHVKVKKAASDHRKGFSGRRAFNRAEDPRNSETPGSRARFLDQSTRYLVAKMEAFDGKSGIWNQTVSPRSPLQRAAKRQVLSYIRDDPIIEEKALPVARLQPIHSLADYHPDPSRRHNKMKKQCERLRILARQYGYNRDWVLKDYFEPAGPFVLEAMFTSRLPVIGGHHHIAGLLYAASQGIVPEAWLDEGIPVKIVYYTGKFPKPLLPFF